MSQRSGQSARKHRGSHPPTSSDHTFSAEEQFTC